MKYCSSLCLVHSCSSKRSRASEPGPTNVPIEELNMNGDTEDKHDHSQFAQTYRLKTSHYRNVIKEES